MAKAYRIGGRRFVWNGCKRLVYVRPAWGRWVPVPEAEASHVVHMWLPRQRGTWRGTVRPVG
jgi:hypothetical protein